jgi:hypothetical protein
MITYLDTNILPIVLKSALYYFKLSDRRDVYVIDYLRYILPRFLDTDFVIWPLVFIIAIIINYILFNIFLVVMKQIFLYIYRKVSRSFEKKLNYEESLDYEIEETYMDAVDDLCLIQTNLKAIYVLTDQTKSVNGQKALGFINDINDIIYKMRE